MEALTGRSVKSVRRFDNRIHSNVEETECAHTK
jgi:hypothetical protein